MRATLPSLILTLLLSCGATDQRGCKVKRPPLHTGSNQPIQPTVTPGGPAGQPSPGMPPAGKPDQLKPEEVAQIVLPSVVLVLSSDGGNGSQGSGFFVKPGLIITNYHVIENGGNITVEFFNSADQKREASSGRVIGIDPEADLAVIEVHEARSVGVRTLSLAAHPLKVGETVFAAGNPKGFVGTFSQGIISSEVRSINRLARLQITAAISPGSSGGPVVNDRGDVIGVAVSSVDESGAQLLNFAVPANLIDQLLRNLDK